MGINITHNTTIPLQKLPLSKKTQEWREACVDGFIGKATDSFIRGRSESEDLKIKYELYNGKFNIKDIEYVTDPYKVDEGFPASPQNFNIIRPKIDLLLGEESKRPSNIKVIQSGSSGASKADEAQMNMLLNNIFAVFQDQMQPDEQGNQPKTPEQIEKYMRYKYADVAEITAHNALRYLTEKLNIPNTLLRGYKDLLISGKEVYYVGIIGGEPVLERVNPIGLYFDKSPDVEFIERGDWAVRHMKMTRPAIYDRLSDILTEKQINDLLSGDASTITKKAPNVNYSSVVYKTNVDNDMRGSNSNDAEYEDVYHVVWRSYKKLGFLTYMDEEGNPQGVLVDESYKFDDEDKAAGNSIEWGWHEEIWEGYKVGNEIYAGINPMDGQQFSIENPNDKTLPYIGGVYSDDNSDYTSLLDIMRPLQYMYIIVWYRLEQALARDKGRVINMDITQIPKSFGMDVKKWMHYLSAFGVNFINPYEEGWDIPGRAGGAAASFNQISSIDLSMSKVIADYIGLMNKIEDMIGELSGVTKQRQGSIAQNELVGNVERSVVQSSHITEPLFWKHNQIKKNVYTALLNASKAAWSESDRQYLHYVLDDSSRIFLNMSKDFLYADFDIFVTDSSKENENLRAIKSLATAAIQSGMATSYEAAEMLTSENLTEIKNKLKELEDRKQQLEQQAAQREQEAAMQQQELASQMQAETNRIQEEDSIRKANTSIEVALIQAESKTTQNVDQSNEYLEQAKLVLTRDKQNKEQSLKERQQREVERSNRAKENMKQREIEIKKKQANKPVSKTK